MEGRMPLKLSPESAALLDHADRVCDESRRIREDTQRRIARMVEHLEQAFETAHAPLPARFRRTRTP
jgi:hypothetical protein